MQSGPYVFTLTGAAQKVVALPAGDGVFDVTVKASAAAMVGGSDVTATVGYPLASTDAPLKLRLGAGDVVYAAGTGTISVLASNSVNTS